MRKSLSLKYEPSSHQEIAGVNEAGVPFIDDATASNVRIPETSARNPFLNPKP